MKLIHAVGRELYAGDQPILLRGFGLGGWFLPEGYMWKLYTKCDRPRRMEAMIKSLCGEDYARGFWERYLDSYITEEDIRLIAKEGFNSVRLPLNARHLYESKGNQLYLKAEMFARIDRLIKWCKKYKLYVILDMHGAPGGQTGQNIDDSEVDHPLLFTELHYEEELLFLWREIAKRYREEGAVAGYDLLNEPVPNFFRQYNNKVLPLYRRIIDTIRQVDQNHMIILEGVHWATDFSIFDALTRQEASDNMMLQFHKYWSSPDADSLQEFLKYAQDLNVPLFMGEGGENNCDWYTTVFPLYERFHISWSFWSYKKMDCTNSPVTFEVPKGWDRLLRWIDSKETISRETAIKIFDNFLECLQNVRVNERVLCALKREVPVNIPCEAFDECDIRSTRVQGAQLRMSEPASLIFENGRRGSVDYKRYGGEEQPEQENVLLMLQARDEVSYLLQSKRNKIRFVIAAQGEGELILSMGLDEVILTISGKRDYKALLKVAKKERSYLKVACTAGMVKLDYINTSYPLDTKE